MALESHRLAGRRGKKRAGGRRHTLLVIIYHIIKYRVDYQDLGPDYFLRLEPRRQKLFGQASGAIGLRGATRGETRRLKRCNN